MYLHNETGASIHLSIVGYEYSGLVKDHLEYDWLVIKIKVTHPNGNWEATDLCLMTTEVQKLIDWFDQIRMKRSVDSILDFIEPNLEFHLVHTKCDEQVLRVYFDVEYRPHWALYDNERREVWLDFKLDELALEKIISSLSEQLSRFPIRH